MEIRILRLRCAALRMTEEKRYRVGKGSNDLRKSWCVLTPAARRGIRADGRWPPLQACLTEEKRYRVGKGSDDLRKSWCVLIPAARRAYGIRRTSDARPYGGIWCSVGNSGWVLLHVILSEPEASRRIRGFTIPPSVLWTATSLYTREAYKERILRLPFDYAQGRSG